jgi:hypothetical protein
MTDPSVIELLCEASGNTDKLSIRAPIMLSRNRPGTFLRQNVNRNVNVADIDAMRKIL